MVETRDNFAERLGKLTKKHKRMTNGYKTKIGKDGLLVVTPRKGNILPRGTGIKILLLVLIGFFAFKSFALSAFGPVTYGERVAKLETGSFVEQIGAKALAIDPATQAVANYLGPLLR